MGSVSLISLMSKPLISINTDPSGIYLLPLNINMFLLNTIISSNMSSPESSYEKLSSEILRLIS